GTPATVAGTSLGSDGATFEQARATPMLGRGAARAVRGMPGGRPGWSSGYFVHPLRPCGEEGRRRRPEHPQRAAKRLPTSVVRLHSNGEGAEAAGRMPSNLDPFSVRAIQDSNLWPWLRRRAVRGSEIVHARPRSSESVRFRVATRSR